VGGRARKPPTSDPPVKGRKVEGGGSDIGCGP
jgi:hypothetical protein